MSQFPDLVDLFESSDRAVSSIQWIWIPLIEGQTRNVSAKRVNFKYLLELPPTSALPTTLNIETENQNNKDL